MSQVNPSRGLPSPMLPIQPLHVPHPAEPILLRACQHCLAGCCNGELQHPLGWCLGIPFTSVHMVRFAVIKTGISRPVPMEVGVPCVPACEQCSCSRSTAVASSDNCTVPKEHPCHRDTLVTSGPPTALPVAQQMSVHP